MSRADHEQELIRAAQGGDPEAFEELVRRNRDRVFWIACQVVGNAEDARDVAQNVLVRLWRSLPRYDPRYAFSTWLYRMTVNLAIDSLRRAQPHAHHLELDETTVVAEPEREGGGGPEAALQASEVERIFAELRDLLPPQQRAVFALREIEGLSAEEVAKVLEVSPSTVRNHLFQARRTLRRALLARYPEYGPRGQGGD